MNVPGAELVPVLLSLAVLTPEIVHVILSVPVCPLELATTHAAAWMDEPAGAANATDQGNAGLTTRTIEPSAITYFTESHRNGDVPVTW